MKVTFLAIGSEQLPVSLLAAIARRDGHQVGLAFSSALFNDRYQLSIPFLAQLVDDRAEVMSTVLAQAPDVLACSALTGVYPWMLDVAREAKEHLPELRVVFGGVHASAVPDVVLEEDVVDFVCVGEGDVAFPALLRQLENGGPTGPIDNIRYRNADGQIVRGTQSAFFQDLDALPFFDKRLWEDHIRVGDFYMTMASRGCPYRCTFCFNNFFAELPDKKPGKYVRQRSVDHMMAELLAAKKRYKLRFIDFEDDIFTVNKGWLHEFLPRYKKEIGLPYQCLTHPKYIDEEVAAWMADSGCAWTQMGVQSADDDYKNHELKRYEKGDHVERAIDLLKKHGVKLKADHIFGLPGEPLSAQEKARHLYSSHTPARLDTFWATYYPGTEMVNQALALGLISEQEVAALARGNTAAWHQAGNVSKDLRSSYGAYELLFRAMPLLPQSLRSKIPAAALAVLPSRVTHYLGVGLDVVNAVRTVSAEHRAYALHYAHSLLRVAAHKTGLPPPPATRPREHAASDFDAPPVAHAPLRVVA